MVADRSIDLGVPLPAHRLMPVALTAPDRGITVVPVCGARTLAEGRPPLGIACAQQDVAQIYPLPDDPERCLEDFAERAAEHAHRLAEQLSHPGGLGPALPRAARGLPRDRLTRAATVRRVRRRAAHRASGSSRSWRVSLLLAR